MLEITIPVQIFLQVSIPLLIGWLLIRRYGTGNTDNLRIFLGGVISFAAAQAILLVLSQVIGGLGLPSIAVEWQGVATAVAFGLGVGILEELARFAVLQFWLRDVRSWAHGLMLGVGHGGAESAFSGGVGLIWFMTMSSLRAGPPAGQEITEAEKANLDQLLASFWSTPWLTPLLSGVQQICMVLVSLGLATLVMRVFLTGKLVYLPAAMALHSLAAGSLVLLGQVGLVYSVAAAAGFAAIGLLIVYRFAQPPPAIASAPPLLAESDKTSPAKPTRPRKKGARKPRAKASAKTSEATGTPEV